MSDPRDRRKPQQQHLCVICAAVTSEDTPVCQRCLQVKAKPQDAFNNLFSEATQAEGATWKPKVKKKKKKNKRKQVTVQLSNASETLRAGLEGPEHKDLPKAKRLVDGPTKVPDKTRDNFGAGWWKSNLMTTQTVSSEPKDDTRLTYKDFYSDSDDEIEGILGKETDVNERNAAPVINPTFASIKGASLEEAEKVKFEELLGTKTDKAVTDKTRLEDKNLYEDSEKEMKDTSSTIKRVIKTNTSTTCASESALATSVSLEEGMSKLELEKTEHKKSKEEKTETTSDQRSSTWGKCSHCKKEGYVWSCSRCKLSSYCDRACQKSHYPQHKAICRRKDTFNLVQSKIPDALKLSLIEKRGAFNLSQFLRDLPSEFEYACGARGVVMAEIIGPYYHLFRFGVVIRDLIGDETHILFYNKSDVYIDQASKNKVRYHLPLCLRPGNFILLLDTHFHPFMDGTVGIRIDDLCQVHFIFEN